MADTYYDPIVIQSGNMTISIRKPILTEEEYNRRFENLKNECGRFMRAVLDARQQNSNDNSAIKKEKNAPTT